MNFLTQNFWVKKFKEKKNLYKTRVTTCPNKNYLNKVFKTYKTTENKYETQNDLQTSKNVNSKIKKTAKHCFG